MNSDSSGRRKRSATHSAKLSERPIQPVNSAPSHQRRLSAAHTAKVSERLNQAVNSAASDRRKEETLPFLARSIILLRRRPTGRRQRATARQPEDTKKMAAGLEPATRKKVMHVFTGGPWLLADCAVAAVSEGRGWRWCTRVHHACTTCAIGPLREFLQ